MPNITTTTPDQLEDTGAHTGPVWFLWHGGSSYAVPAVPEDIETAGTAGDMLEVLEDRRNNRDGRTPCVDDTAGAHVFYSDPSDALDAYPDQVAVWGGESYVLELA